jgi:hypothetical protein
VQGTHDADVFRLVATGPSINELESLSGSLEKPSTAVWMFPGRKMSWRKLKEGDPPREGVMRQAQLRLKEPKLRKFWMRKRR